MEGAKPGGAAAAQGQGGGAPYDELEGRECVICMSAARDTMVLPCRHMWWVAGGGGWVGAGSVWEGGA
jgi:hypothetical protein